MANEQGQIQLPADPWAGYKTNKPKTTNAAKKTAKVAAFTPDEVTATFEKVATFDKKNCELLVTLYRGLYRRAP